MVTIRLSDLLTSSIAPDASILYSGKELPREPLLSLQPSRVLVLSPQAPDDGQDGILTYCRAPLEELKTGEPFDCIIQDESLQNRETISRTLQILRRLCRDGSTLILRTDGCPSLLRRIQTLFSHYDTRRGGWLPDHLLDTLLAMSGFSLQRQTDPWLLAQAIPLQERRHCSYSIIIPCYNEEGSIAECLKRLPDLQRDCEIIVVNDGSTDRTAEVVRSMMPGRPALRLVDYDQNRGKGYAVRAGLEASTKEVLMILDADMAVRPEDLPLFMEPFECSDAEFVNSTRMIYPFTRAAMGPLHVFGNRMFARLLSLLLNHPLTDTLCGTKCLYRRNYQHFCLTDPDWPDFDLLFEASRQGLKIVELPIRYQPRRAGVSKMRTFRHGWLMLLGALRRFVALKTRSGKPAGIAGEQ